MAGKIIDITEICNVCMHNWVNDDGSENNHCKECNYSDKQKTMINFEQLLGEDE